MPNPNFGKFTGRPGGEPPPRRQHTPEELRVRETFNRAEHLKQAGINGNPSASATQAPPQVDSVFDEQAIRYNLNQLGLDFQIFPVGEKPPDPNGRAQYREARITELESERAAMRTRTLNAEQTTADVLGDLKTVTTERDTLLKELETLKSENAQEAT